MASVPRPRIGDRHQCRSRNSLLLSSAQATSSHAFRRSRGRGDVVEERGPLGVGVGLAAEGGQVELVEDRGVVGARRRAAGRSGCRRRSSLRRTASPLIIWNAWASVVDSDRSHSQVSSRSGLPKTLRNAPPGRRPGNCDGAERRRGVGERLGLAERLADRVEQDLGGQEPDRRRGRSWPRRRRWSRSGCGAELVGPRLHDQGDQRPEPHPAGDELGGQGVEQRGVGRRVRVAEVVDRLDDAPAHQVEPDPVGQVPGELAVVARQPVGQVVEGVGVVAAGRASGRAGAWAPSSRRSGAGPSRAGPSR